MKKDLDLIHNVAFLIGELEEYVDEIDLSIYDDYSEMKSAQKEVLKLLKNLRRRREHEIQRRRFGR